MGKSTEKSASRKVSKPQKPYPDFPLTPHASGKWQKKIRNPITGKSKIHYFGRWGRVVRGSMQRLPGDGWQEALELYKSQADDLHAGRTPRPKDPDGLTLRVLCNKYLNAKLRKKSAGEFSARSFQDVKKTTDRLIAFFGKDRLVDDIAADDFGQLRADMAKNWGPGRLSNEITRVKGVFKFAYDNALIDKPIRYGSEFKKPDKAVLRRHKAQSGKKMIDAETVHNLIEKADPQLKAMILLAVNCGYGNTDLSDLQQRMIDGDWIDYPRPKTGIERRSPLWPETKEAIGAALAVRPDPADESDSDCVFLRANGKRWVRHTKKSRTDGIANEFTKLAREAGVRKGLGLYSLRHTFQSIADTARDPIATKYLMGHADPTMSGVYREFVSDENLIAVSNHVRAWLFGEGGVK